MADVHKQSVEYRGAKRGEHIVLKPTFGSRFLIIVNFILPALAVYFIGFEGWKAAAFSSFLLLIFLLGVSLLVPAWNWLSWDGDTLKVRTGPFPARCIPGEALRESGRWMYFFLPVYVNRPVLVWHDTEGRRRSRALMHVFGSGINETRSMISGCRDG
ncbi:hypothetical protein [Pseudosulfitobacter pseudonitzschiae]|uniref:hypothetical protein n=1 Tax=Pseudosulfitobacter pseudonitzschiae TaxID=1402135 RepID=UPI003B7B5859